MIKRAVAVLALIVPATVAAQVAIEYGVTSAKSAPATSSVARSLNATNDRISKALQNPTSATRSVRAEQTRQASARKKGEAAAQVGSIPLAAPISVQGSTSDKRSSSRLDEAKYKRTVTVQLEK
jgi:hypothetical protein